VSRRLRTIRLNRIRYRMTFFFGNL
jgi:hypothetical protein